MQLYIPKHSDLQGYVFPSLWVKLLIDGRLYCVVPENIQTPTTEGIGNSKGVGGSMAQEIPKGRGVSRPNSLPDGRKMIDFL